MIDILLKGVGWTDIALTLDRVAVGMFFMFSGYHKLFNAQRHRALVDELTALHVAALRINQWWVPSVEFAAGGAVFIGLLTPLAALGLLVIVLVASVTSGRVRIKGYQPIDRADRIDNWLYLARSLVCVHADHIRFGRGRAVQPRCRDLTPGSAMSLEFLFFTAPVAAPVVGLEADDPAWLAETTRLSSGIRVMS